MSAEEKLRLSDEYSRKEMFSGLPTIETPFQPCRRSALHPGVYITAWIALSATVILFNKWILDQRQFKYPIILTAWHLVVATGMTQLLARTTSLLDGRKNFKMTRKVYVRAVLPIGIFFSLSLIFGNLSYVYLSVAFIQMLKATTPVAVLLGGWTMGVAKPKLGVLANVCIIVLGVIIATFAEIKFVTLGFLYQCSGIAAEAIRLVLIQKLLHGADHKMDPLVSLYYFAPLCALLNLIVALVLEVPKITSGEITAIGVPVLIANALVAFLLNISSVFLIGRTSSLALTLCGVLKDILLIAISMMLWSTPVSLVQFFGYAISIAGLIYYKVGIGQLKTGLKTARQQCRDFATTRAAKRNGLLVLMGMVMLFFYISVVAPENMEMKSYIGVSGPGLELLP